MAEWGDIVKALGATGCLLLFIYGLHKMWWVMGSEYLAMREDRDFYRDRAWNGTDLADTATRGIEQTVQRQLPAPPHPTHPPAIKPGG